MLFEALLGKCSKSRVSFQREHSARQCAPGEFECFEKSTKGMPPGVSIIFGTRSNGYTDIQCVKFDAAQWTIKAAQALLRGSKLKDEIEPAPHVLKVTKVDTDQRLVFGWMYVCRDKLGKQVVDHSGEVVSISEIEKAAYKYALNSRDACVMHERNADGSVYKVGSLIESTVFTKEKQAAQGIPEGCVPEGWWVGYKIDDDATWARVKSGELSCFSIGGLAERREVRS